MKHVLCAFCDMEEDILREIFRCGREYGWLVEYSPRTIYPDWSGDGVITDYLRLEELRRIANFRNTPIVSRELPPRGNIRTVHTDTTLVAAMVINYIESRGFQNVAIAGNRKWPGELDGVAQDPGEPFEQLARERGLNLFRCYWAPNLYYNEQESYRHILETLERFFREIPKPTALFVKRRIHLNIIYRVLEKIGLKVPEEIAILCNSVSPLIAENAMVPTTYVSGEMRQVGMLLADTLRRMMDGEHLPEEPIRIAPDAIITRRSTDVFVVPHLKLKKALNFFQENAFSNIGVADGAAAAGLSTSMLNRLFRRYLHQSALDYLRELRLNRIRHLLAESDLTLTEIAAQTGYSSKIALSAAFRASDGMSPGAYRKKTRRQSEQGKFLLE